MKTKNKADIPLHLNLRELRRLVYIQAEKIRQLEAEKARHQELAKKFEHEAHHDVLTGMPNRRGFDLYASSAWESGESLCLIAVDLDHFKKVNDVYGHDVGDAVLKHFADSAKAALRKSDIVSRFGGEEFFIAFKDENLNDSCVILRKIARQMSSNPIEVNGEPLEYSFSAGGVKWRANEPFGSASKRADKLLYVAKTTGRKRVVIESEFACSEPVSVEIFDSPRRKLSR